MEQPAGTNGNAECASGTFLTMPDICDLPVELIQHIARLLLTPGDPNRWVVQASFVSVVHACRYLRYALLTDPVFVRRLPLPLFHACVLGMLPLAQKALHPDGNALAAVVAARCGHLHGMNQLRRRDMALCAELL